MKGYTLIELMIVITIMTILFAIIFGNTDTSIVEGVTSIDCPQVR